MGAKYDVIGSNYAALRRPDQRIARIIEEALGSAQSILNVGAGTGSRTASSRPANVHSIGVVTQRIFVERPAGLAAVDGDNKPCRA